VDFYVCYVVLRSTKVATVVVDHPRIPNKMLKLERLILVEPFYIVEKERKIN